MLAGLVFGILLLVPVAGKTVYGAKRWLSLGFMSIQPSELAKLAVDRADARTRRPPWGLSLRSRTDYL